MKKRAIQYALLFFAAGVIITLVVGYVQRSAFKSYEETQPYLSLTSTVKNNLFLARLSLGEVNSDSSAALQTNVIARIDTSRALLRAAYEGRSSAFGPFTKFMDEESRAMLKGSILAIEKLREQVLARNRTRLMYESMQLPITANLEEDKIQGRFDELESSMDRFTVRVEEAASAERSSLKKYSWAIISLLFLVFTALAVFVFRQRKRSDSIAEENRERMTNQERSVTSLSSFIEAISAGDFTAQLQLDGEDHLSSAMLNMRDKLRENADNDRKRNWNTTGLAQIGEILRTNHESITDLYDNIVKFIVKYTNSNQGGLFLLNEEGADKHLDLVACHAFERKKFLQKKLAVGEGLVGQCFLESQRIYLAQVPEEYITITSGLGGANPNALLIVPLRVNEKMYGVLELATFGKYEEYQIELVEKLAETIAATISSVRINESTKQLLERTQQQAEEMRAQEEEMRQNMEELEATQEEMRRKEKHIEVMLEAEKKRNDFNNRGRQLIIELSKSEALLSGHWQKSLEQISRTVGEHLKVSRVTIFSYDEIMSVLETDVIYHLDQNDFSGGPKLGSNQFPAFMRAVKSEKIIIAKVAESDPDTRELKSFYLDPNHVQSMLLLPFLSEGRIAGVISCENSALTDWSDDYVEFLKSCADLLTVTKNTVRINAMVTNLSEAQETLQTIIDNLPRAVFWKDRDLRIQGCNKIFASVAGKKSHMELIGKTDFDMPWRDHAEAYRADDQHVMQTRVSRIDHEEKNVNSEGRESWVLTSKVPVMNKDGEVVAVLGMFEDITDRKRKEADVDMKLKELEQLRNMLQKQKN